MTSILDYRTKRKTYLGEHKMADGHWHLLKRMFHRATDAKDYERAVSARYQRLITAAAMHKMQEVAA